MNECEWPYELNTVKGTLFTEKEASFLVGMRYFCQKTGYESTKHIFWVVSARFMRNEGSIYQ